MFMFYLLDLLSGSDDTKLATARTIDLGILCEMCMWPQHPDKTTKGPPELLQFRWGRDGVVEGTM